MFMFYADAAHGWLEVSASVLARVGMLPTAFSRFSYVDRKPAVPVYYLEEDCDAAKFLAVWESKNGKAEFTDAPYQQNSFIRSLPRIV
jgi:hypothetical protein